MHNFIGAKPKSLGHQWRDPSIIGAPMRQTRISMDQDGILSDFNKVNYNFIWITSKSLGLDFNNAQFHGGKTQIIGASMGRPINHWGTNEANQNSIAPRRNSFGLQ